MRRSTLAAGVLTILLIPLAACGGTTEEPAAPNTASNSENRLIGYQVKRLDQLIELTFDRLLADAGLSRRQWQTLNTIARGPIDDAGLTDALRPFWETDSGNLSEVVTDLTDRGWISRDTTGHYTLTDAGRTAHTTARDTVSRLRELSADGVSEQEFGQMMDVMGRIIGNLERATA